MLLMKKHSTNTNPFSLHQCLRKSYINNSISYCSSFVAFTAMFSHVVIWHGKTIVRQVKAMISQVDSPDDHDIHNRLMSRYRQIPEWAFGVFLVVTMIFFAVVTQVTKFTIPLGYTF